MSGLSAHDINELSIPDDDIDDFFAPEDREGWASPEDHARVIRQRDQFISASMGYAGDMSDAGRAMFALIERFGPQMHAHERAQLLQIHECLVYPEAVLHEEVACLTEAFDAQMLVDISDGDTGLIVAGRVVLAAIVDDRRERARIRSEIEREGGATLDDGRRVTAIPSPNGIVVRFP